MTELREIQRQPVGGHGTLDHRQRGLHRLANRAVEEGRLGDRLGHEGAVNQGSQAGTVLDHRNLTYVPGAHEVERLADLS